RTGSEEPEGEPDPADVTGVLGAETGVEEDEAVVGLDQQAVTDDLGGLEPAAFAGDQPPAPGAHRPAVEVMDAHGAGRSLLGVDSAGRRSIVGATPEWRNWHTRSTQNRLP